MIGITWVWNFFIFHSKNIWNDSVAAWNSDKVFGLFKLPYAPNTIPIQDMFVLSIEIALILLIISIVWFWLGSMKQTVIAINKKTAKLTESHPIYALVYDVCKQSHHMKMPMVYIAANEERNAFALSKPFRSAIILNEGILAIPERELAWVIAHELGHIYYGDADSSALWISIRQVERFALKIRYYFLNLTYPILLKLPFMKIFSTPIYGILSMLIWITDLASKCSQYTFKILDSYAQRKMEYRADTFASKIINVQYGLNVLFRLDGCIEGNFDVFATHPPMKKRIQRLKNQFSC